MFGQVIGVDATLNSHTLYTVLRQTSSAFCIRAGPEHPHLELPQNNVQTLPNSPGGYLLIDQEAVQIQLVKKKSKMKRFKEPKTSGFQGGPLKILSEANPLMIHESIALSALCSNPRLPNSTGLPGRPARPSQFGVLFKSLQWDARIYRVESPAGYQSGFSCVFGPSWSFCPLIPNHFAADPKWSGGSDMASSLQLAPRPRPGPVSIGPVTKPNRHRTAAPHRSATNF